MRTFIAVEIPEKERKPIWTLITEQKKKNLPIKWVEFQNLHITLKFLGEIDEKKLERMIPLLSTISGKTKSFKMSLENIGCFPGIRNPRVLWVGVIQGSDELIKLAIDIENELYKIGIKKEEKKFHPHLTIGRIKTPCNVDDIINQPIKTNQFDVKEFILFKSTLQPSGPIYEKLKKFPLL